MIGTKVVDRLTRRGHRAIAASRSTGVDAVTGDGLDQVLTGADVVVDVSSAGTSDAGGMLRFFEAAGATLASAEWGAGVAHHVALSAVGAGRVASGYFVAKRVQEDLVVASGIPFTIVRATPFFEYIYNIVDAGATGDIIRLPPVRVQPIAADDVADALVRVALGRPANGIVEIAGPDTCSLTSLAETILTANEDPRTIIVEDDAPYFGARLGDEPLTGGEHRQFASTRFADWLRGSFVPPRLRVAAAFFPKSRWRGSQRLQPGAPQ